MPARPLLRAFFVFAMLLAAALHSVLACGDGSAIVVPFSPGARDAGRDRDGERDDDGAARAFDFALPPPGAPDRGRTPGALLLRVGVVFRCAAVLIASDVALTPARCVLDERCQPVSPDALWLATPDAPSPLALSVRTIMIRGDPCAGDDALAALVLSAHADGVGPLAVRARPLAAGERVRVAGIGNQGRSFARIVRDHLRVDASARAVARIASDGCTILPGAIALDESTGELVGVGAAPSGADCDAATVALLQVDAFREAIADAIAAAADGDAGKPRPGKAVRPTLDLGEPCATAVDCAAGVCVFEGVARYCSRLCGTGDRCPNGMRCVRAIEGRMACVESG